MIRRLRIKFICIVTAIAALMVGGILGVVIYFTAQNMEMQSVSMMRTLTAAPFQMSAPVKSPNDEVRLPFFTVQIGDDGELRTVGGGYFDLSDREDLQQLVDHVLREEQEYGELEEYDLRYLKLGSPMGTSVVFSDTATEAATLKNLFYSCLFIFFAAVLVFFGISILLSRWAIKPVAKAWEQQRQFVADASHELKTPLAVILSNAELLQNEEGAGQSPFSGNILSTAYQMRSLVENLLEMARVDNGALKLHFEPVDLSELVSDAVLSVRLLYAEKNLELCCECADGIRVPGSEPHLYQVMDVLLDNALKYSGTGGAVSVRLSPAGRSCLLSVASPGEAISREDLKRIFERFYRADRARTMNGSYGLGLSIAQAVVTAHKGKIWAESADGYNTFHVQLPVHANSP